MNLEHMKFPDWIRNFSRICNLNWGSFGLLFQKQRSVLQITWELHSICITKPSKCFQNWCLFRIWRTDWLSWKHYRRLYWKAQVSGLIKLLLWRNKICFLLEKWSVLVHCPTTEAYDKMQGELVKARNNLTRILTSKDVKATVCITIFTHSAFNYILSA